MKQKSAIKAFLCVLLIMAAAGWAYHRSARLRQGSVANNGNSNESPFPTVEEVKTNLKAAEAAADLAPDQKKKIDPLINKAVVLMKDVMKEDPHPSDSGTSAALVYGQLFDIARQGQAVLTPDQQKKFQQAMTQQSRQRNARLRAALGSDYARYREKQRQRIAAMGGWGALFGGGRGGGTLSPGQPGSASPPR